MESNKLQMTAITLLAALALTGCGGGGGSSSAGIDAAMAATVDSNDPDPDPVEETEPTDPTFEPFGPDTTNLILENSSPNCADYAGEYTSTVLLAWQTPTATYPLAAA